jgi:hypothetical protein
MSRGSHTFGWCERVGTLTLFKALLVERWDVET